MTGQNDPQEQHDLSDTARAVIDTLSHQTDEFSHKDFQYRRRLPRVLSTLKLRRN